MIVALILAAALLVGMLAIGAIFGVAIRDVQEGLFAGFLAWLLLIFLLLIFLGAAWLIHLVTQ